MIINLWRFYGRETRLHFCLPLSRPEAVRIRILIIIIIDGHMGCGCTLMEGGSDWAFVDYLMKMKHISMWGR
jgi:hypothetical protein